jgi:hypothetical protein
LSPRTTVLPVARPVEAMDRGSARRTPKPASALPWPWLRTRAPSFIVVHGGACRGTATTLTHILPWVVGWGTVQGGRARAGVLRGKGQAGGGSGRSGLAARGDTREGSTPASCFPTRLRNLPQLPRRRSRAPQSRWLNTGLVQAHWSAIARTRAHTLVHATGGGAGERGARRGERAPPPTTWLGGGEKKGMWTSFRDR